MGIYQTLELTEIPLARLDQGFHYPAQCSELRRNSADDSMHLLASRHHTIQPVAFFQAARTENSGMNVGDDLQV
ncbi:hypothetical protein D9M69_380430 [compost metagenome]